MEVAILGGGQGWPFAELDRAFRARGHRARVFRISALVAHIGDGPSLDADGAALQDVDAVLARSIPAGSLEQVVFRVDALHWLERLGIPVMNPATAIERTVDKFYTSALLDAAGLPTPRTVVAERLTDTLHVVGCRRCIEVGEQRAVGGCTRVGKGLPTRWPRREIEPVTA